MKLSFKNASPDLKDGIILFSREYEFEVDETGICVKLEHTDLNSISVIKKRDCIIIRYNKKIHFFRGLGLLVEALREKDEFEIYEEVQFNMNGVMIDISQANAVINVANVKKILMNMAAMGLDMLMLYAEDNYEIEDEPYFGYMRGRYTFEELKECDDYAFNFGIEMIPCIQTLAHLHEVLKWDRYAGIRDDNDILLVGNDRTYEFIEKMIKAASKPFRSKRIHIGMDEANNLGLGRYLSINGCKKKFDIMAEHLERVLEITALYGLKPIIWSDMYFRAGSNTGDYYDTDSIIPQEVINKIPREVRLVYWDYYHNNEEFYVDMINKHKEFGSMPVFAGGIWTWKGYCANYGKTFATVNAGLNACKKEGIREVIATIWGDGGSESNIYSNLPGLQLFAEHGYSRQIDNEKLARRFNFCTGANFDDFMDIKYLDEITSSGLINADVNPCKYVLWQDPLMGLFDKNIDGLDISGHYEWLKNRMGVHAGNNGEYGFLFRLIEKLCAVLELKSDMGLKLHDSYTKNEKAELERIANNDLPELSRRVNDLRTFHRELWFEINKPFGWEVLDIRYGGLLARIDSTKDRISAYLDGKIDAIDELEIERLYYSEVPGLVNCNTYSRMPTASRM